MQSLKLALTSDVILFVQASEAEERRTVLASLKGHGKSQKVGSIRVGAVKKSG